MKIKKQLQIVCNKEELNSIITKQLKNGYIPVSLYQNREVFTNIYKFYITFEEEEK